MANDSTKKVKMTLLLDEESLRNLRQYGVDIANTGSISKIVRIMANNYAKEKKSKQ